MRERAEDSYDWDGGDEQSTFDVAAVGQLGRACQAFVFVAGDLAISPESAQHQSAEAMGKGAKGGKGGVDFRFKGKGESVKGGWGWYGKSGFTDNGLGKGNKGKSGGKGYQGICWLCGEVGHKAAECGGKERRSGGVEAVEEEEVVADVGGVWTVASVEKGTTKAKGRRRARRWRLCTRTIVACWRWTVEIWPCAPSKRRRRCTSWMSEPSHLGSKLWTGL